MEKELKDVYLKIRLTKSEKEILKEKAAGIGMNVSQYVLFKLIREKNN